MTSDASPPDWATSLRGRRAAANLSRKALADQSGISIKMIQAIELGARRPGPETRAAIDRVIADRLPPATVEERLTRLEQAVLGAA